MQDNFFRSIGSECRHVDGDDEVFDEADADADLRILINRLVMLMMLMMVMMLANLILDDSAATVVLRSLPLQSGMCYIMTIYIILKTSPARLFGDLANTKGPLGHCWPTED